jgi:polyhydroxyalkanoate synthesis regulator phasin
MTTSFTKFAAGSLVAAAFVFSLSFAASANAQSRGSRATGQRLQGMQHQEASQVRQGVRNGSLTTDQAKNLTSHMDQMQSSIKADQANGKLTPQEAKQLTSETKKVAKAINGAENSKTPPTSPPTHQ